MSHGPDRQSFMGSAAIHVAAVVLIWVTQVVRPEPMEFVAYQIEIVSPPPAEAAQEPRPAAEELVVDTPEEPEPEAPPPPEPERQEVETPPPETPEEQPPAEEEEAEPEEESPPAAEEADPEKGEEGGENIEVRMEGLRRDYPVYYQNIIRQIYRCFRPQGGQSGLEATVQFYITRDGSVEDLEIVRESRSPAFDIQAMGAVECAGNGRFGPLPEEMGLDRLPVRFNFRPRGGDPQDLESRPERT